MLVSVLGQARVNHQPHCGFDRTSTVTLSYHPVRLFKDSVMSERDDLVLQQLIVACWELFLLVLHKSAICTRVEVGEDYSQKGHLTT